MKSYRFTLILAEREDSEGDADELYAQFDDGTLITCEGVTRVEFDREAASLSEAIHTAIADVERTRFRVGHVETPETHVVDEINAELMANEST
jgi:phage baseplate assembly protein gpV